MWWRAPHRIGHDDDERLDGEWRDYDNIDKKWGTMEEKKDFESNTIGNGDQGGSTKIRWSGNNEWGRRTGWRRRKFQI